MSKFSLSDKFLSKYEGKQPNWGFGDLSYFTYKRTYSRLKEDGTQEEFFDTVKRVVEGCFQLQMDHCKGTGLPWDASKAQRTAQKMFEKIWEFKFTPPGRGFWMMGTEAVKRKGSACLYNCAFISTKNIKKDFSHPFAWTMDMLMLGVGIGFDTKGEGLVTISKPTGPEQEYIIPDSREGWVESMRLLLDSYANGKDTPITFDYSKIRPAGEPIRGFGGTSSGFYPLKRGHESIKELLDTLDGKEITSVAITDIMNFIGKLVVAGNIRRAALIGLGDSNDKNFIQMKDPDKFGFELSDRRWSSNNSVFIGEDYTIDGLIDLIARNGEPGLCNLSNMQQYGRLKDGKHKPGSQFYDYCEGVNPCGEINLESQETCNISETYPANHDSYEEYLDTLKYAFLYSKSVSLLPTHSKETNSVLLRNRRIGISMTGVQQALKKHGHSTFFNKFCDLGYEKVKHWDAIYSRWLGIPQSIKTTTIKPSGSVSLLAGATPGVHCTHAPFYLRSVRVAANSPLIGALEKAKYRLEVSLTDVKAISDMYNSEQFHDQTKVFDPKDLDYTDPEHCIFTWNDFSKSEKNYLKEKGVTLVAYFPVKEHNFTKSKFDISVWEQLSLVRELQSNWADNSVSVTVTFKPEEKEDVKSAINFFLPYTKSLSFLPLHEHTYLQAPYTEISEEEYETYQKSLKKLDLTHSTETEIEGDKFCSNDVCAI